MEGHSENFYGGVPGIENHWEKELEKTSLKEPGFQSKFFWVKPLSYFHEMEYRGMDPRDIYTPTVKDEYDFLVWNIPINRRGICRDYYVDFVQCGTAISAKYGHANSTQHKIHKYCWKPHINYLHCMESFAQNHPEFFIKGSKLGHH